jgi:hypothetical protein
VPVVRSWSFCFVTAVLSIGCSSEIDHGPVLASDVETASNPRGSSDTTSAGGATTKAAANACETDASWGARGDFALERSSPGDVFAEAVTALIRRSDVPPIAVSTRMDPNCVWRVAFSAAEGVEAMGTGHPTIFTPMLRHPAGLWTAAPQSAGWLRIIDRSSRAVWIPIVEITGSANYGEASCATLSAVRVSATIPVSAADLSLMTAGGERTVRELMASEPSTRGWDVRFTFSADIAR